MAALAHAEEAAERHDRVGDLAGELVDHEARHRAESLALAVVDRRALDLARGDQLLGLVRGDRAGPCGDVLHRDLPSAIVGKKPGPERDGSADLPVSLGGASAYFGCLVMARMSPCASRRTASSFASGAFFPLEAACKPERLRYPPAGGPEGIPSRPERHNLHSITSVRRLLAVALARPCPPLLSAALQSRARRFLPRESPPEALARARLRRLADRLNETRGAASVIARRVRSSRSIWRPRPARPNLNPAPVALRVETAHSNDIADL